MVETETRDDMRHTTNRRSPNGVPAEPEPQRRGRSLVALVVAGGLLSACGGGTTAESTANDAQSSDAATAGSGDEIAFGLVSPEEAATLASDSDITVLDVRTTLDPEGTYLVYCRSGNRSGQATALMADLGFEQVYDLDGGVLAWDAQGLALTP